MRTLALAAALLLAACGGSRDDDIDPVPTPSAESANRLMSEAEEAAGNAAARMDAITPTNNATVENAQ